MSLEKHHDLSCTNCDCYSFGSLESLGVSIAAWMWENGRIPTKKKKDQPLTKGGHELQLAWPWSAEFNWGSISPVPRKLQTSLPFIALSVFLLLGHPTVIGIACNCAPTFCLSLPASETYLGPSRPTQLQCCKGFADSRGHLVFAKNDPKKKLTTPPGIWHHKTRKAPGNLWKIRQQTQF